MEFNHKADDITSAIVGTDTETMETLLREILSNPPAVIGECPSEYSEWVYDNVEDPNILGVVSLLIREGISKMRDDHGKPKEGSDGDLPPELQELLDKLETLKVKLEKVGV